MALSADQLNTIYQNVLFRNVDVAGIQFFANRQDISDAQVRQQIELSAEASQFVSPIVRLYQTVLGRVPDAAGLRFFSYELRQGFSLEQITTQILNSAEFQAKTTATAGSVDTPDLANTNQLVTDTFQAILGRSPAPGELTFFQGRSAASILSLIAGSPEATQVNAAGTLTFLDAVAQGTYPTGSLSTFTLTANADNLTGTDGSNSFVGTTANISDADVINGGAGNDTLTLTGALATGFTLPTGAQITGVENLVVRITPAAPGDASAITADVSNYADFRTVSIEQGTAAAVAVTTKSNVTSVTTTGGTTVQVTDSATTGDTLSTVSITGNTGAATIASDALTSLSLKNTNQDATVTAAAGTRALSLSLDNVTGGTVADATATSISLKTVNTASTGLTLSAAAATALTISGDKSVSLTLGGTTAPATIDASGDTGGVTITSTLAANTAFTGGTGADVITLGATTKAIALGAGDDKVSLDSTANLAAITGTIDGGTGNDTLSVAGGDYTTPGSTTTTGGTTTTTVTSLDFLNNKVSNIETIAFTGATGTQLNGNTFSNAGVTKFLFDTVGSDVITNAGSARTYAFGTDNGGDATLTTKIGVTAINLGFEGTTTDSAGTDSLTVNFNPGADPVGTAYTVNIASNGSTAVGAANATGQITTVANSTINITGSHALTVAGLANAETVNASTFTGKLTLTGSAGADTITVGSGGSLIVGGASADTITLGTGADVVSYTAADQSGVVTSSVLGTIDTINNFTVGTGAAADKLAAANATFTAISAATQTTINSAASITEAANAAAAGHAEIGWTAFNFQGSAYALYEASAAPTSGTDTTAEFVTGDFIVKLVGVDAANLVANNFVSNA